MKSITYSTKTIRFFYLSKILFSLLLAFFLHSILFGQPCPNFQILSFEAIENPGNTTHEFFAGCTPVNFEITLITSEDELVYPVTLTLELHESSFDFSNSYPGPFTQVIPDPTPGDELATFTADVLIPGVNDPEEGVRTYKFVVPVAANYNPLSDPFPLKAFLTAQYDNCTPKEEDLSIFPEVPRVVGCDGCLKTLSEVAIDDPNDGIDYQSLLDPDFDNQPQDVIIKGALVVNLAEYTFNTGSNVMLDKNARIFIQGYPNSLIVASSDVQGCKEMWDFILLGAGGYLSLYNSVIEDGKEAIRSESGGDMNLINNKFRNNNVGLYVPPNAGLPNGISFILFDGNTFESTELLKEPLFNQGRPFAGVELNDVIDFAYLVGTPGNTNYFKGLRNGIIARNSNVFVGNAIFEDILKSTAPTSLPFTGRAIHVESNIKDRTLSQWGFGNEETDTHSFSNCSIGIYSEGMNMSVRDNHMQQMGTGVDVRHSQLKGIAINNNRINASSIGINLYQNTKVDYASIIDNTLIIDDTDNEPSFTKAIGIKADENAVMASFIHGNFYLDYSISDNIIELHNAKKGISFSNAILARIRSNTVTAANSFVNDPKGIEINGSRYTTVACNYLLGNGLNGEARGIHVLGAYGSVLRCNLLDEQRAGVNYFGMCSNSAYLGNKTYDAYDGLLLGSYSTAGSDTWIGEQRYRGNLWVGSYPNSPAFYNLINPDHAVNSRFIIDPSHPQYAFQHPSGIVPSTSWFVDQTTSQSTYGCTVNNACPEGYGEPGFIDELARKIAQRQVESGICEDAVNWTGSRHLYEYIKANPGLEQSEQLVQDFLDSVVNTSIGAFYEIDRDMDGLFTLDSLTQAQLDSNRAGIDETMEQIISIDSLLREGVPSQDSAQLAEQRDSLSHQLDSLMQETDALMQTIADTRELEIANILADNAAVVTPTLFEDNQKAVNDIFLRTIARGQSDFSQTDLDTLRAIANQCFICGGDAVFLARSLYAKTDSVLVYDDDNLCGSVSQPLMKPKDNNPVQASFTLIPNPAADWLIVEILNENPFNGDMRIFDVSGKEVLAVPLNLEKVSSVPVDISMLHAGMYVCNFYQNGRPVQTERLSVIK